MLVFKSIDIFLKGFHLLHLNFERLILKYPINLSVRLPGPESVCPIGYSACSDSSTCLAATEVSLAWDEAVKEMHACPNGGSIISDK